MIGRMLAVGLIVIPYGVVLLLLIDEFAGGGCWTRIAVGAILLIAVPTSWQLARLGGGYIRSGR